jgi:hypothetical protein
MHGDKRNVYNILLGKTEGKRPLGRLVCRRKDDVKMYLKIYRLMSQGISVSFVSDYRLDNWGLIPGRGK